MKKFLASIMNKFSVLYRMRGVYKNWVRLALYRTNIFPQPMIISTRDGCRVSVRGRKEEPADAYVANETWLYGIHDALLPSMGDAKIGFDIGAHIGTFSVWAARHSPAHIYAFEPAEHNLVMLKKNVSLNGLEDRIEIVSKVVASVSGAKNLYITKNSGLISTVKEHTERTDSGGIISTESVSAVSLADFFSEKKIEYCDFMKVDIESGEYELFMNLPDDVYKKIGAMSVEIGNHVEELTAHIAGKGFSVSRPYTDFGEYIFTKK